MGSAHVAVERALAAVTEELGRHAQGVGAISDIDQLLKMRSQLEEMQGQLSSGNLPSRDSRTRGLGRVIADSWPLGSELGEVILAAEQAYLMA